MKEKRILIYLIAILLLSFYFVSTKDNTVKNQPIKKIAIITRSKNSDNWENLKQGAEQAALDKNAVISFINLSEAESLKEQKLLLEREIKSGADAILLSPIDETGMAEPLARAAHKVSLVCIESCAKVTDKISFVTCNNRKIGKDLANEVMRHGNTRKNILVLTGDSKAGAVSERREAFKKCIENSKNRYMEWQQNSSEPKKIVSMLCKNTIDVIAALDTNILEQAAKGVIEYEKQTGEKIELYGVGSNRSILSYLEKGVITSIVVQDDFSIGYLGVTGALEQQENKKLTQNNQITYAVIDYEHMYSKKNQWLLFPFVR